MKNVVTSVWANQPTVRRFWTLCGALIAWLILLSTIPNVIARAMGYSGTLALFVLSNAPGYTPAQAHTYLTIYGSAGRMAYAMSLVLFDIVFPILYASVFSVGLRLVTRGMGFSPRVQAIAGIVPFAAAAANWLADVCIISLLVGYPSQLAPVATVASAMTFVKFLVIALSFVSLLTGATYLLARRIVRK